MRPQKRDDSHPEAFESTVLESFARQVFTLAQADGAAVAVREAQGWFYRASVGNAPHAASKAETQSPLIRQCLETGSVVICQDSQADDRLPSRPGGVLPFRSAVAIPIKASGSVLAVMELFSQRPFAFSVDHLAESQRHAAFLALLLDAGPGAPEEEPDRPATAQRGLLLEFPSPLKPPIMPPKRTLASGRVWIVATAALALLAVLGILLLHRSRQSSPALHIAPATHTLDGTPAAKPPTPRNAVALDVRDNSRRRLAPVDPRTQQPRRPRQMVAGQNQ